MNYSASASLLSLSSSSLIKKMHPKPITSKNHSKVLLENLLYDNKTRSSRNGSNSHFDHTIGNTFRCKRNSHDFEYQCNLNGFKVPQMMNKAKHSRLIALRIIPKKQGMSDNQRKCNLFLVAKKFVKGDMNGNVQNSIVCINDKGTHRQLLSRNYSTDSLLLKNIAILKSNRVNSKKDMKPVNAFETMKTKLSLENVKMSHLFYEQHKAIGNQVNFIKNFTTRIMSSRRNLKY